MHQRVNSSIRRIKTIIVRTNAPKDNIRESIPASEGLRLKSNSFTNVDNFLSESQFQHQKD